MKRINFVFAIAIIFGYTWQPSYAMQWGESFIIQAVKRGDYNGAIKIIRAYPYYDLNDTDANGETALMLLAKDFLPSKRPGKSSNRLETIKLLLKDGANPNLISKQGETALMFALDARNSEVATLLLDAGATSQGLTVCDIEKLQIENNSELHPGMTKVIKRLKELKK